METNYMARLERWARWMLPRQEAEDVIADYQDIVGTPPRTDEELLRDLGRPRDVIRSLSQARQYRAWLAMFVLMAACIVLPGTSPLPGGLVPIWNGLFYQFLIPGIPFSLSSMAVGLALSLIWFRPRRDDPKTPLPRPIPIALAVLLAVMGLVWWVFWQITLYPEGALSNPIFHLPLDFWWYLGGGLSAGNLIVFLLEWCAIPLMLLGITALVKARIRDRRWRAVYFLSLSTLMLAFCVLSLLSSMDLTAADPWTHTRRLCLIITIGGLVGTGVSLC